MFGPILKRIKQIFQSPNPISQPIITQNPSTNPKFPIKPSALTGNLISRSTVAHLYPTKTHALDGLVALLIKLQRRKTAKNVIKIIEKKKYAEDLTTFNSVIKSLTRHGDISIAQRVLQVMVARGIRPDGVTSNFIAQGRLRNKELEEGDVVLVLKEMKGEGTRPNGKTCHELVLQALRMHDFDRVLECVSKMAEQGFQLRRRTLYCVFSLMLRRRKVTEVVDYVRGFPVKDKEKEAQVFRVLVRNLINTGRNREAHRVVQEMIRRDLPVGKKLLALTVN